MSVCLSVLERLRWRALSVTCGCGCGCGWVGVGGWEWVGGWVGNDDEAPFDSVYLLY